MAFLQPLQPPFDLLQPSLVSLCSFDQFNIVGASLRLLICHCHSFSSLIVVPLAFLELCPASPTLLRPYQAIFNMFGLPRAAFGIHRVSPSLSSLAMAFLQTIWPPLSFLDSPELALAFSERPQPSLNLFGFFQSSTSNFF